MPSIDGVMFDIGRLDELSRLDTPVHRLDPRAKVLATACFILAVVSFGKYEIVALLPFILYPVALLSLAGLPWGYVLRKVLLAVPFVLFVAIFNPLLDREPMVRIGAVTLSGGWVSFLSIMIRFALTVSAAFILIACTGLDAVCLGLERMRVPKAMVVQLLFLHRYLFVLMEETSRTIRAYSLRSFRRSGVLWRVFGSLVGLLLLRTIDRAQRIHAAMLSRAFDGEIRIARRLSFGWRDALFVAGWAAFFVLARLVNLPRALGNLVMRTMQ